MWKYHSEKELSATTKTSSAVDDSGGRQPDDDVCGDRDPIKINEHLEDIADDDKGGGHGK